MNATDYFEGEALPASVWTEKYALRDRDDKVTEENPDFMHRRIAREFARIEKTKFKKPYTEEYIYSLLKDFSSLIPQGSPMYGIGNPQYVSLSNCFVTTPPTDSYGGIMLTDEQMVQLCKRRGGVGTDISEIRPDSMPTTNSARSATGILPFMERFSNSIREVGQNGRRGALMLTLSVHHPQVLDFARVKLDPTKVTGANVSIRLSDEFLKAVETDGYYEQRWPVDSKKPQISKSVKAREVWTEIIKCAHARAEPGLLFWDQIIRESPADCYEQFKTRSTNPCQPAHALLLTPYGLRPLGHLSAGDTIWSEDGWVRIKRKWSTGVKKVYRYRTTAGVVYSTENHRILQNGVKVEVADADSIDLLLGPSMETVQYDVQAMLDGSLCPKWCVPEKYLQAESRKVISFLRGLFSSQGEVISNRIRLKTSSNVLAEDVQILLSSLGIASRLATGDFDDNFELSIDYYLDRFDRLIGFEHNEKADKLRTQVSNEKKAKARKITYDLISKAFYSEEEVFDIEVDGPHHTYWHGGHNVSNCGEIPLSVLDSCRLLVVNFFSCVEKPFTKFAKIDYYRLFNLAYVGQRLMDDLVDLEIECVDRILAKIDTDPEPDEVKATERMTWTKIREAAVQGRRTGLGPTALGDTLAAIGVGYGDEESVEIVGRLYRTLKLGAYRASVDMAEELGPFPAWLAEKEINCPFLLRIKDEAPTLYADMQQYGRRNIALLTTAPTGSVSLLAGPRPYFGKTSGFEPLFRDRPYTRRKKVNHAEKAATVDFVDNLGDQWTEYEVFHPMIEMWMDVTGETDWKKSPYHGYCAEEIDWRMRVKLQAEAQKHVDHSISSTVNLPNTVSVESVAEIYETAWRAGCKGITVYRDGCRDGVLVDTKPKAEPAPTKSQAKKRPSALVCEVHQTSVRGQKCAVFVGLLDGAPYEAFASLDVGDRSFEGLGSLHKVKRGHYLWSNLEGDEFALTSHLTDEQAAITRLVSTALRHGTDVAFVVHQLEKVKGDLNGFAKAMARVLKKYVQDGTKVTGEVCGRCGGDELVRQEGCVTCRACGMSKCN